MRSLPTAERTSTCPPHQRRYGGHYRCDAPHSPSRQVPPSLPALSWPRLWEDLPRRVDVTRTDGATAELLGHRSPKVGEGPLHRLHGWSKHLFAVLPGPGIGAGYLAKRSLEVRHHMARE